MNKRVMSFVLVFALLFTTLSFAASAAELPDPTMGISVDNAEPKTTDTFTVTVFFPALKDQFDAADLKVNFDKTLVEATAVTASSITGAGKQSSTADEANGKGYFSASYMATEGDPIDFPGVTVTATFRFKDGVAVGTEATFEADGNDFYISRYDPDAFDDVEVMPVDAVKSVKVTAACPHASLTEHPSEPSTCLAQGHSTYFTCDSCNKMFSDAAGENEIAAIPTLPLGDHDYGALIPEVPAVTHETDGVAAHYECSACGKLFDEKYQEVTIDDLTIPAGSHDYSMQYNTENHWRECGCGNIIEQAAHSFSWVEDKAATEEETGLKHEECGVCGYKRNEGTVIGKLPHTHNMQKTEAVPATCTEAGNIEYYTCTKCGKYYTDAEGKNEITANDIADPAKGHAMTPVAEQSSTCLEQGHGAYYTCSACHKMFSDSEGKNELAEIPTLPLGDHDYGSLIPEVAAVTHETDGTAAHYECSVCHKLFDANHNEVTAADLVLPAGSHDYSMQSNAGTHWRECACGSTIEQANHSFIWVQDKAATEEETGLKHEECTVCGYKRNEGTVIDKLEHVHAMQKTEAIPATCTEDGNIEYYTCTKCGKLYRDENGLNEIAQADTVDPAKGHTLAHTERVEADHHKAGNIEYWKCSVCHKYFSDAEGKTEISEDSTVIPQIPHTFPETWKNDANNHWHECECGEKSGEAAHTFLWVVDKEATEKEAGSKHEECSVCGYRKDAVGIPAGASAYAVTEGANAEITKGEETSLVVKTDGDSGKITAVEADGKTIPSSAYTKTGAGRTELTLTPEYLKTLETGEHTLVIRYNDGTAETRFTIKANTSVTPAPATGDSGALLFAFLCAASLFAAAALLPRKKEND